MSRNVSFLFRQSFSNSSQFDSHLRSQNFGSFYTVSLLASIVVAVLSPVAVVGNALVLAAICKNPSLRTPSYILLAGLAFTDFVTGLITQPVYVANEVIHLKDPTLKVLYNSRSTNKVMEAITNSCAVFFSSTSVLIITLMSIERWLHMTRRSLVTVRRVCIIIAVMLVLPLPFSGVPCTVRNYGNLRPCIRNVFRFTFASVPSYHFCSLLQSFPNYSSASAANPGEWILPQYRSTIDRLCQVQEICPLDPLYSGCLLHRLPAHVYYLDGTCFFE